MKVITVVPHAVQVKTADVKAFKPGNWQNILNIPKDLNSSCRNSKTYLRYSKFNNKMK